MAWNWTRKLTGAPREVAPPAAVKAPEPEPVKVTDVPSAAAGTSGTPFFGCADIHTPHFGVCHTPLDLGENPTEEKDA